MRTFRYYSSSSTLYQELIVVVLNFKVWVGEVHLRYIIKSIIFLWSFVVCIKKKVRLLFTILIGPYQAKKEFLNTPRKTLVDPSKGCRKIKLRVAQSFSSNKCSDKYSLDPSKGYCRIEAHSIIIVFMKFVEPR